MTTPSPDRLLPSSPLLAAWRRSRDADLAPFTIPGHKRLAGHISPALGRLLDSDVPLYGGLDEVKLTAGVLAQAERLGAQLWGADFCRYSTGGSTHANQAVALAVGQPGDTVLVARNAHRSTLLGLVFAGLVPVWLPAEIDPVLGVPRGLDLAGVHSALAAHPEAVALFCVEPGYLGAISDLPAVITAAHDRDIPVIVDQAWGAHLGFHPDHPAHALSLGADALVMSAHKTLPAYSQAAILAARTQRLDADRLERAFEAANTTSPAGSILASIDASRAVLDSDHGRQLLADLTRRVDQARQAVTAAGGRALSPADFAPGRFDPAKLVLLTAASGHDGLELERRLLAAGLPVEMADRDTVVPLVSLADDDTSLSRLVDALTGALRGAGGAPRPVVPAAQWTATAPQVLTPREAFFAAHRTLPIAEAIGSVSAELVAPYPPGIPVLMPGEEVTEASVAALQRARAAGARIAYAADPELHTLQVVSSEPDRDTPSRPAPAMPGEPAMAALSIAVADHGDDPVALAAALIGIDSANPGLTEEGPGEGAVATFLADRLAAAGFDVRLLTPAGLPDRPSLLAVHRGGPGRTVLLNGHLDTVGHEDMPDALSPRIADGRLYGRGACDMKSGVAAIVVAAERAARAGVGTIVLALVADEENDSVGSETVLADLVAAGRLPDVCLVAEPSWLDLTVAHRGFAVVRVDIRGRSAHSSQPTAGVNAVAHLGRLLAAVEAADGELRSRPAHPLVGHGSLMATVAAGGTAPFSLAAHAHVLIERRTVPGERSQDALAQVQQMVDALTAADPTVVMTCSLVMARSPWQQSEDPVAIRLAAELETALTTRGRTVNRVGFPAWMESALYQEAGIPTVACGPAGGGMHADDEWVEVAQIVDFTDALSEALDVLLPPAPAVGGPWVNEASR